jgi:hypothetical protein
VSDDWKNEDDIKAELRVLTDELKTLRHELRNMVAPPKVSPARAFLHRQSWPKASEPRAKTDDRTPPKPEARSRKKR